MRVFLSSVDRGLEEERANVASIISAMGNKVVRFEDFGALNATSRVACLNAVMSADCYLLLLGPNYGSPDADTGLSPTEEEYNTARANGIPILTFDKSDIQMDPRQVEFRHRIGSYPTGRFWASFSGLGDLGPAVISALRGLGISPPPVSWRSVAPRTARPVHDTSTREPVAAPRGSSIIEVHVIPIDEIPLRRPSERRRLSDQVTAAMRTSNFVKPSDPLCDINDPGSVHIQRPSNQSRKGGGWNGRTSDPYRGVRLGPSGDGAAYSCLPRDTMGSLTNSEDLTDHIQKLLEQITPFISAEAKACAVTANLLDDGITELGDPAQLGGSRSGSMGYGRADIVLPANAAVSLASIIGEPHEVARDVAARLCEALRDRR